MTSQEFRSSAERRAKARAITFEQVSVLKEEALAISGKATVAGQNEAIMQLGRIKGYMEAITKLEELLEPNPREMKVVEATYPDPVRTNNL